MKKPVVLVMLVLILLISCSPQEQDLNVGVIVPLSGSLAFIGEDFVNGLQMSLDETNASVNLILRDGKGNAKDSTSATFNLLGTENIDVLVTLQSAVAVPLTTIAEDHGIPIITSAINQDEYTNMSRFAFRLYYPASQEAKMNAEFAEQLGKENVALLYVLDEYGISMRDNFKNHFSGRLVLEEGFDTQNQDFKTLLLKASERDVALLYFVAYPAQYIQIVEQREELGMNVTLIANSVMTTDFTREVLGELFDNIYATSPASHADEAFNKGFVQKYEDKYGKDPDWLAAFGYDTGLILNELAGTQNPIETLHSLSVDGVNGNISFDIQGETQIKLVVIRADKGESSIVHS